MVNQPDCRHCGISFSADLFVYRKARSIYESICKPCNRAKASEQAQKKRYAHSISGMAWLKGLHKRYESHLKSGPVQPDHLLCRGCGCGSKANEFVYLPKRERWDSLCKACNAGFANSWYRDNPERAKEYRLAQRGFDLHTGWLDLVGRNLEGEARRDGSAQPDFMSCRECGCTSDKKEFVFIPKRNYWDNLCQECNRKAVRMWLGENREQARASAKAWRENNRDRVRDSRRLRKASGGVFVATDYVAIRDGYICGICELPVHADDYHIDHIVPVSSGGQHVFFNLQVAHPQCNLRKGAKILADARPKAHLAIEATT